MRHMARRALRTKTAAFVASWARPIVTSWELLLPVSRGALIPATDGPGWGVTSNTDWLANAQHHQTNRTCDGTGLDRSTFRSPRPGIDVAPDRELGAKGFIVFHRDHCYDEHLAAIREAVEAGRSALGNK